MIDQSAAVFTYVVSGVTSVDVLILLTQTLQALSQLMARVQDSMYKDSDHGGERQCVRDRVGRRYVQGRISLILCLIEGEVESARRDVDHFGDVELLAESVERAGRQ